MIKAVIFDLDNTLVDFMKMKDLAIDAAILAMIDTGLNLTKDEAKTKIKDIYEKQGIEYQQVFDEFLKQTIQSIDYKILSAGIVAYRKAREAALIPYPHVYSSLNSLLKLGMKLGILSDAPIKEAWLRLAYMNFHHTFDAVVTFDETGLRKPEPAPFYAILKKLDVEPQEALMVGDWVARDIIGASKIGMKTAFAKYGDTFNTVEHSADYELEDISQICDIIRSENNK